MVLRTWLQILHTRPMVGWQSVSPFLEFEWVCDFFDQEGTAEMMTCGSQDYVTKAM